MELFLYFFSSGFETPHFLMPKKSCYFLFLRWKNVFWSRFAAIVVVKSYNHGRTRRDESSSFPFSVVSLPAKSSSSCLVPTASFLYSALNFTIQSQMYEYVFFSFSLFFRTSYRISRSNGVSFFWKCTYKIHSSRKLSRWCLCFYSLQFLQTKPTDTIFMLEFLKFYCRRFFIFISLSAYVVFLSARRLIQTITRQLENAEKRERGGRGKQIVNWQQKKTREKRSYSWFWSRLLQVIVSWKKILACKETERVSWHSFRLTNAPPYSPEFLFINL